jgi:hypothetical protein
MTDFENDVLLLARIKTRCLDRNRIGAGRQILKVIIALTVCKECLCTDEGRRGNSNRMFDLYRARAYLLYEY